MHRNVPLEGPVQGGPWHRVRFLRLAERNLVLVDGLERRRQRFVRVLAHFSSAGALKGCKQKKCSSSGLWVTRRGIGFGKGQQMELSAVHFVRLNDLATQFRQCTGC